MQAIIPELDVTDFDRSRAFYVDVLGFEVVFERDEERFVFLEREGAQLMLEQAGGPGRRFHTASLQPPLGRGMNLQIRVTEVGALYESVVAAGARLILGLEEAWYRRGDRWSGNRQFVVADPDGYMLRFAAELGSRATPL